MSNEQDKYEMDELVARTYRELDVEQAPDHLNRTILQMASEKRSSSFFAFAGWMKPVAWAATAGLSLAIVLEFSQLPSGTNGLSDAAPAIAPISEDFMRQSTETLQKAEDQARMQSGPNQEPGRGDEDTQEPSMESSRNRLKATMPRAEPDRAVMLVEDAEVLSTETAGDPDTLAPPSPAASKPAARKMSADRPAVAEQTASFAVSMERKASDVTDACDETVRQSAQGWLECIEKLRESGAVESADREYEAFILEYPAESAELGPNK